MACGMHLFANAFPQSFGEQLCLQSKTQMCPPPNVLPCPAMCLPASKWFCVPRNCKVQRQDGDIHLALQLATDKWNRVFNRGSSIISQSDSRFASQPNRSRIAAASQKNLSTRAWLARLLQKSVDASKSRCSP